MVRGDVRHPEDIEDIVCQVRRDLGEIDIFVSNAGRMAPAQLPDIDATVWDEAMTEHARAAFLFSKRLIPGMESRGYGRILFISSISAYNGGVLGPSLLRGEGGTPRPHAQPGSSLCEIRHNGKLDRAVPD